MGYGKMSMQGRRRVLMWADANAWYEKVVPIRGKEVRPAFERRNQNLTLRKLYGGDIALHLYNTDVVTWHTDDSITLRIAGWKTRCTADAIFRATLIVVRFGYHVSFVRTDAGYYAFGDQVTLSKDGVPREIMPVYRPVLDRRIAAKVRKDMGTYAQWCGVVNKMGVDCPWRSLSPTASNIVAAILDSVPDIEEDFPVLHQLTRGDVSAVYAIAYKLREAYLHAPIPQPIPVLTEALCRKVKKES